MQCLNYLRRLWPLHLNAKKCDLLVLLMKSFLTGIIPGILRSSNVFKKRLQHRCFLVNFVKFLKHLFCETSANSCLCIPEVEPSPSKKIGFIGPLTIARNSSILPSRSFSCYCIIVFAKFWHGARNPYKVVHDRARFSGKKILPKKSEKAVFFNWLNNLVINFY